MHLSGFVFSSWYWYLKFKCCLLCVWRAGFTSCLLLKCQCAISRLASFETSLLSLFWILRSCDLGDLVRSVAQYEKNAFSFSGLRFSFILPKSCLNLVIPERVYTAMAGFEHACRERKRLSDPISTYITVCHLFGQRVYFQANTSI